MVYQNRTKFKTTDNIAFKLYKLFRKDNNVVITKNTCKFESLLFKQRLKIEYMHRGYYLN